MADVDMKSWVRAFESQMKAEFGSRVCFLGLQGSRARGEAHAGSDIDAVAILDKMSLDELARYRAVLEKLPHLAALFLEKKSFAGGNPPSFCSFILTQCPCAARWIFCARRSRRRRRSMPCFRVRAASTTPVRTIMCMRAAAKPCAGCASRRCLCCAPSIIAKQVCFCAPGASWRLRWPGRRPVCCAARRHLLRAQRALKRRAACC